MAFTKSPLQPPSTSSNTVRFCIGNIRSSISMLLRRPGRKACGIAEGCLFKLPVWVELRTSVLGEDGLTLPSGLALGVEDFSSLLLLIDAVLGVAVVGVVVVFASGDVVAATTPD